MRRTTAALAGAAVALAACSGSGTADQTTDDTAVETTEAPSGAPSLDQEAADGMAEPDVGPDPQPQFPVDVTFADHGVAGFVATADLAASTFATDADTASFALAQAWLEREGALPPAEAIRPEEWINAVDHQYPDPEPGETWRVVSDLGTPWWTTTGDADTQLLRVGLQAQRDVDRQPVVVTLVVDTSGSMEMDGRIGLVQRAVDGLLGQLGPEDRVAVVEYGSQASVVADPTSEVEAVRDAIASLTPSGSTNAEDGLRQGFDLARRAYDPEATNTVVLLSDGVANVGATGPDDILERIVAEAEDGVVLHSVGVGMSNFNDVLLERLANDAGGSYAYVDQPAEATELFTSTLPVLDPVAHDVKAQVELDPEVVEQWRLIGYENRLLEEEDLRDETVGGGYVGAGHSVTALYEVVLTEDGARGPLGTATVVWNDPVTGEVDEVTAPLSPTAVEADTGTFATAAGVAAAAETLRGSPHVEVDLDDLADRLAATGQVADARYADLVRQAAGAAQPTSGPRTEIDPPGIDIEDRTG